MLSLNLHINSSFSFSLQMHPESIHIIITFLFLFSHRIYFISLFLRLPCMIPPPTLVYWGNGMSDLEISELCAAVVGQNLQKTSYTLPLNKHLSWAK